MSRTTRNGTTACLVVTCTCYTVPCLLFLVNKICSCRVKPLMQVLAVYLVAFLRRLAARLADMAVGRGPSRLRLSVCPEFIPGNKCRA